MGSVFFEILGSGGITEALNLVNEKMSSLATIIKLPALVLFVLGAVAAILVGSVGYKYIKLFSTACFAVAGYGIGNALFDVAKAHWNWNVPNLIGTIVGLAFLALLGYLAYKKFAYALFGVACFTGFVLAYFVYPNYLLAIAAGVIVALLSMHFVRYAFVTITSFGAGFVLISMLSAIAPNSALLKLGEGFMGKFFAVIVSLLFVAIQFRTTGGIASGSGSDILKKHGPKRVKIRRVFDIW